MKTFKYCISVLATLAVVTGCNKFLDRFPTDEVSSNTVFTSGELAESAVIAAYSNILYDYTSADLDRVQTSWDYDGARCGLMDARGAVLVPAQYREIRALSEDRLLMTGDGEALLSDLDGHVVKRWITAEAEAATGE